MRFNNVKYKQTKYNTRIAYINYYRVAELLYNGEVIAELIEESNDSMEFDWVIKVNWKVWKGVGEPPIPGIDEGLHLKEYIRTFVLYVVTQRTLPDNRENLYEELERVGLTSNDAYEYMCRTGGLCGNNSFTVKRKCEYRVGIDGKKTYYNKSTKWG